jgi:hypothetical protein
MQRSIGIFLTVIIASVAMSPASAAEHRLFDEVLRAHVNDGFVDYAAIEADRRFLQYIEYLENADPDSLSSADEKLAFWINAYNAFAIKAVLDGLSTEGFFSRLRFFTTDFRLAGRQIDLYDLEQDIIIPFGDPRIHFAIVCASASCPKLISEAYVAERLERQLEDNARAFINNPAKNRFDSSRESAQLSMIFKWFAEDFEADATTVQRYLAKYVEDPAIAAGLGNDEYRVEYLDYDWSLNGRRPPPAAPAENDAATRSNDR